MIEDSSRGILYESICLRRAKDGKHYLVNFKRGKGETHYYAYAGISRAKSESGYIARRTVRFDWGVPTYSAIERGAKQMSWSTFLSLILFYDCNQKTHQVLRSIKAIPQEVMLAFNAGNTAKDVNLDLFLGDGTNAIIENLDEQAMRSIRTMIMVEYARCTSTPGEVIVKSFDGMNFNVPVAPNAKAKEAYRAIKEIKQTHEE